MHHVIIAGATGLIGHELIEQLNDKQCQQVTALTRRDVALPYPHQHCEIVDYDNLKLENASGDSDAVICALGTTIKAAGSRKAFEAVDYDMVISLATQAKQKGYKTFAVVSSLSADKPGKNFYLSVKQKMESSLLSLGFETLVIARPSLLLGRKHSIRIGEKIGQYLFFLLGPLMLGSLKKYRPIPAPKVATALIKQCSRPELGLVILENNELHQN